MLPTKKTGNDLWDLSSRKVKDSESRDLFDEEESAIEASSQSQQDPESILL